MQPCRGSWALLASHPSSSQQEQHLGSCWGAGASLTLGYKLFTGSGMGFAALLAHVQGCPLLSECWERGNGPWITGVQLGLLLREQGVVGCAGTAAFVLKSRSCACGVVGITSAPHAEIPALCLQGFWDHFCPALSVLGQSG